jgi:hypothetical protein
VALASVAGCLGRGKDYERLPEHHETMVRWTMIRITGRRLTKQNPV